MIVLFFNGLHKFLFLLLNGNVFYRQYQPKTLQSVYQFKKKIIIIHLCSIDRLSSSDPICRSSSQLTKSDRQSLPRNQVFGDKVVDSFVTSASNLVQSSITNSRQGIQRRKNQQ